MTDSLIVTIDGPAGSGKSSVARLLAERLGVDFLDTGAMYRGITVMALTRGIEPAAEPHLVTELARHRPLHFDWKTDPPRLYGGETDLTDRLRDHDVAGKVSDVAAIGGVRQVLVEAQRRIGEDHPRLVTEGRDQGSVVFPNASVKFYLDASPAERARRRVAQLHEAGKKADLEAIRQNIIERDHKDSTRKDGPLMCPDGAIRIDTTPMSRDEVLDHLEAKVRELTGAAG